MTIYVFSEGDTEQKVIARLIQGAEIKPIPGKGKHQINRQIQSTLEPELAQGVRCLVLRDLDEHEGETVERITQGVADALRRACERTGHHGAAVALSQHGDYPGVYTWVSRHPDIRLALHVAIYRWHEGFVKSTIDDYVLALALREATARELIADKGWAIAPQQLINKIVFEIPTLLTGNGILLREAKDYVRLYAAVLQEHTSPPTFTGKTLAHAEPGDIRAAFAPLLAAAEFVRG